MHDIWNPWHGCRKCSEGCEHCYMYFLDRMREQDGSRIYRTKNGFRYPLSRDRQGKYKVQSGENYDGSRPCRYEWVKLLSDQCRRYDVTFNFIETGTYFIKDGRTYRIPDKRIQSRQAFRSGLNYKGRGIRFRLTDEWGYDIPEEELYTPHYHPVTCAECSNRLTCNGCSDCGKCGEQ